MTLLSFIDSTEPSFLELLLFVFVVSVVSFFYFGSLLWVYTDAKSLGKSGCIPLLLVWFFWPISLVVWLLLRPLAASEQAEKEEPRSVPRKDADRVAPHRLGVPGDPIREESDRNAVRCRTHSAAIPGTAARTAATESGRALITACRVAGGARTLSVSLCTRITPSLVQPPSILR